MAYYEPLNPQVIGPQWTPVRQESIPFDLGTELGYTFTVTGSGETPKSVEWALSHVPTTLVKGQTDFATIYRRGEEANVGPVQRVVIPVTSILATGVTAFGPLVSNRLQDPYDESWLRLDPGDSLIRGFLSFNVSYLNGLAGKRILRCNLLYTANGGFNELDNETSGVYAALTSDTNTWSFGLGSINGPLNHIDTVPVQRVSLGDVNPFWNGPDPYAQSDRYPWRSDEIFNMTSGATTNRIALSIGGTNLPTLNNPIDIQYMALEVAFCEENRLWYGGNARGRSADAFDPALERFNVTNTIELRTTSFQTTGTIDPGDYTVTLTLADSGNFFNRGDKASYAALRQFEEIPHPGPRGVEITKWVDPDGLSEFDTSPNASQFHFAGDPPSVEPSNILPGLSILNSSDSPLGVIAPHTYALLNGAPVYTDITARQLIINDAGGAEVSYPWVRFYARRFGTLSRTLRIMSLANPAFYATITQDALDALPEIVDGWREVTLRFDSATPSFSDDLSLVEWQWDTIDGMVTPQNRWEVTTAVHGFTTSASPTYGGNTAYATYQDIYSLSGTTDINQSADSTLMFSQDPIAVSGLAVEVLSQEVTGIGLECVTLPECIPTGIAYHHITWDAGEIVCDTFSRAVTGGWGEADTGQAYTTTGGANTTSSVGGGTGAFIQSATGSHRETLTTVNQTDPDMYVMFSINQEATAGASLTAGFTARGADPLNQYVLSARCNDDNTITALIERVVAGSFTALASNTVPGIEFFPDQTYEMRARLDGTSLMIRVWESGLEEPTIWHATATDATYTSGAVGLRGNVAAAYSGEFPVIFTFDHFTSSEITVVGSHYELQRQDDVDTDWQTIMESVDLCPVDFNDYEARVGIESRYRIRLVNALRFPGLWSDDVASTLTDPGVFGVGDGNSVLIFTSNERQAGSSNLAYTMNWERSVEEGFEFPESDTVQLQPMYNRDFVVAFRPTERGGERFSRTLLVNNSAVPTGLIREGFRSLRDMAWEDVSYVCVRNELGDRWLATVLVPSGVIQRNRRLYLATVDIIEVTDTPSIVTLPEFNGG